jgi:hypothetical protein
VYANCDYGWTPRESRKYAVQPQRVCHGGPLLGAHEARQGGGHGHNRPPRLPLPQHHQQPHVGPFAGTSGKTGEPNLNVKNCWPPSPPPSNSPWSANSPSSCSIGSYHTTTSIFYSISIVTSLYHQLVITAIHHHMDQPIIDQICAAAFHASSEAPEIV